MEVACVIRDKDFKQCVLCQVYVGLNLIADHMLYHSQDERIGSGMCDNQCALIAMIYSRIAYYHIPASGRDSGCFLIILRVPL